MYNNSPALAEAAHTLLRGVVQGLRELGWSDPMSMVEPDEDLLDFWASPSTLLSQTCGYPLVTQLTDRVSVLARPQFDIEGCEDHGYCSVVVVRADAKTQDLSELQGQRLAFNSPDSHSGMNALRHRLAPVAASRPSDGRFFSELLLTGSHANSLSLVQSQQADVCAVDIVTWHNQSTHRPESVQGLRVLARTHPAPSLPWICNRALNATQQAQLLAAVLALPQREPAACAALRLTGFKPSTLADYRVITAMENEASALGYPVLR
jgi:ABC-type phosphate/phosphonate transport system substrate-binding protein